jgi:GNAT superfamily N-acetyltransferase
MPTVIAEESFMAILPELMPLFVLHHSETGLYREFKGRMPMKPDVDRYGFAEKIGVLFTLTARIDGKLVGYYVAVVQSSLHYADFIQAQTDIPYVHPDVRHRGIGVRLFLTAEKKLKQRGVKFWQMGSKLDSDLHPSMDRALKHLGFAPSDLIYSKWLGD